VELTVYDSSLTPLGVADELNSLLWTRRYWSPGECKILAPFTTVNNKLLRQGNLIHKPGDNELAEIRYVQIKKNSTGMEEIEAQGRFLSGWLDKRILLAEINTTATAQVLIKRVITENLISPTVTERAIPFLLLDSSEGTIATTAVQFQGELYANCLDVCEGLAKESAIGYRITTDLRTKAHTFRVLQGRDLSASQSANRPCVFSQAFDNVLEQEFVTSSENQRTTLYVGGVDSDVAVSRVVVEVRPTSGLARSEKFIDASDIKRNYKSGTSTLTYSTAVYQAMLKARGEKELAAYGLSLSFESKIKTDGSLCYRTDFDVGDIVTCVDSRWGVRVDARITEMTETYQKGRQEVVATFGDSLPTLMQKIKR